MVNSEDKKEYFFIFDIDETLTKPKSKITKEMVGLIKNLTKLGKIFLVGGAKFENINEQTLDISEYVEYIFCENGTSVYKNGNLIKKQELLGKINESELQKVINFILKTLSKIILPFKRGTFIEFRTGLINVSPLGRNCTLEERKLFEEFDKEKNVLSSLKDDIDNFLSTSNINLISTFGGKISLDIFPKDSTKSCCLNFLETEYDFNNKIY